jgi:hypothetical protein
MRDPYQMKLAHGEVLDLTYSFKAIRHFEKITGGNFFGDSASGRIGADYLVAGIAAGLLAGNPRVKVEDVESAIEKHMAAGGDLPTLINDLMEALKRSGVLRGSQEDRPPLPAEDAGK